MDTLGPVKIGKPTVLPSIIDNDFVMSIEKSPYLVNGALVVKPGAKLTMNPGTVVWFRSLGLIVKGQLEILRKTIRFVYQAWGPRDGRVFFWTIAPKSIKSTTVISRTPNSVSGHQSRMSPSKIAYSRTTSGVS